MEKASSGRGEEILRKHYEARAMVWLSQAYAFVFVPLAFRPITIGDERALPFAVISGVSACLMVAVSRSRSSFRQSLAQIAVDYAVVGLPSLEEDLGPISRIIYKRDKGCLR